MAMQYHDDGMGDPSNHSTMTKDTAHSVSVMPKDDDEAMLRKLGYNQELNRGLNGFSNFAVSFSVVSVLTGITGLFGFGMTYGGPVAVIWGWLLVSFFTFTVALSMAEICSAYPTSGALYFYAAKLAGPKWAPLASFFTGWFNLLGQVAVTAGIDFTFASFLATIITLGTGGANGGGWVPTQAQLLGIYAGTLVVHGCLNTFANKLLALLNGISVVWHVVGTFAFIATLLAVAPTHQSAEYVFTEFNHPDKGIASNALIFMLGLLMSQFTLTGYDASAHMTEETKGASKSGPRGIVMTVACSSCVGFLYILSLLFSIQDPANLFSPDSETAGGYASAQVIWDAFAARYGSGKRGIALMMIPLFGQFFCGMASITSNSRMLYAFARDGAVPGSRWWHQINPRTKTPVNAVWLCVCCSFILGLPLLESSVVFTAVTSIATIGLYISYVLPVLLRITVARKSFVRGSFHLGSLSIVVGVMACFWVAFVTVIFVLPIEDPVTKDNLNYAGVAVAIVLVFTTGWWFAPGSLGARTWFTGPKAQVLNGDNSNPHFHVEPEDGFLTVIGKTHAVVV